MLLYHWYSINYNYQILTSLKKVIWFIWVLESDEIASSCQWLDDNKRMVSSCLWFTLLVQTIKQIKSNIDRRIVKKKKHRLKKSTINTIKSGKGYTHFVPFTKFNLVSQIIDPVKDCALFDNFWYMSLLIITKCHYSTCNYAFLYI